MSRVLFIRIATVGCASLAMTEDFRCPDVITRLRRSRGNPHPLLPKEMLLLKSTGNVVFKGAGPQLVTPITGTKMLKKVLGFKAK